MKRDTQAQQRENNPQQTNRSTSPAGEQTDRERSIQTDRERGRSSGITRRQPTSPMLGSPYTPTANPYLLMRRMVDDMERIFDNFGFGRTPSGLTPFLGADIDSDLWGQGTALQQGNWSPQVETFRRGDNLVIRADLPGLRKEDVNVEVDDGMLAISGERRDEKEEDRNDFYRSERFYGQFYRAIPLPDGVNADQVDASFKDGVLELTLPVPKELEHKAKRVQIR